MRRWMFSSGGRKRLGIDYMWILRDKTCVIEIWKNKIVQLEFKGQNYTIMIFEELKLQLNLKKYFNWVFFIPLE